MTPDDLSHHAATTVAHDMDTARWPHTRDWLTGFLATPETTPDLTRIDLTRDQLTEAENPTEAAVFRQAAIRHLTQRFHQVLTHRPTAHDDLSTFVTTRTTPPPPPRHVVQTATATDHSQIFQSGGSQNISFDNRRRRG